MELIIIKIIVAVLTVLFLALLAEYCSPRVAGIIGGSAIGGTAIVLFFFGYEHGIDLVRGAIPGTIAGLGGEVFFYVGYYYGSQLLKKNTSHIAHIISAAMVGLIFFFLHAIAISYLKLTLVSATIIFAVAVVMGTLYLRRIPHAKSPVKAPFTFRTLLIRASFAAVVILLITITPYYVPSQWAGIFSAFPTGILPFLIIVHYTYGDGIFPVFLRNIAWSITTLVVYVFAIYYLYPIYGVGIGTLLGEIISFVYLGFILFARKFSKS